MRRVSGDSRGVNNAFETISAAATAIASADGRLHRATPPKRRWGSCWSLYWCFGYHKHSKRIGHAVLLPETVTSGIDAFVAENSNEAAGITLPFIAPPSSPASFLPSETPSASQSPGGVLSFTSVSANMFSPSDRPSIFAIGPYSHETQLVSPPVFSTFTTEPSTAPFTPPPESVHLTTPSSPEVPFAQLLEPNPNNGEAGQNQRFPLSHYEFQSHQFYPGSPVGQLISPNSGISGSGPSSPFLDREFVPNGPHFIHLHAGEPLKLLTLERLSTHEWGSRLGSGSVTPDAGRMSTHEQRSWRGSGSVTPDAGRLSPHEQRSWRGSGSVTPDAGRLSPHEQRSWRGSGSVTPDAGRLSPHERGSWRGSGSVTPDAGGMSTHEQRSRRGSGSVTPDAGKLSPLERGSWRGSAGSVTPDATMQSIHERGSQRGSGSVTPNSVGPNYQDNALLECPTLVLASLSSSEDGCNQGNVVVAGHRVSFELISEDVIRCVEGREAFGESVSTPLESKSKSGDEESSDLGNGSKCYVGETINQTAEKALVAEVDEGQRHQRHHSITLGSGSGRDFKFDHIDRHSKNPNIGSDWCFNEQLIPKEGSPSKSWSFFPMLQSSVS